MRRFRRYGVDRERRFKRSEFEVCADCACVHPVSVYEIGFYRPNVARAAKDGVRSIRHLTCDISDSTVEEVIGNGKLREVRMWDCPNVSCDTESEMDRIKRIIGRT